MEPTERRRGRWPIGYRLILWFVGVCAALLVLWALFFVLGAQR